MMTSLPTPQGAIGLVGFDGDDTLWKSEDYYRKAEQDYLDILSRYIDVHDTQTARHLLEVQQRNLGVFGYGVKGMTLSMVEAAIEITNQTISARDLQQMLDIGHDTLRHPVELIDGVRESVTEIARDYPVVLITKGDLFHQEAKIKLANLRDLFPRIEIVSETPGNLRPRAGGVRSADRALRDGRQFAALGHRAGDHPGRLGHPHPVRGDLGARNPAWRRRR